MWAHCTGNQQLVLCRVQTQFEVLLVDAGPLVAGCCIMLDIACDIGSFFVEEGSEVINSDA